MRKTSLVASLLVLCCGPMWPALATAGPYADDLSKCLVKQTAAADRTALMNWVFAAMALHPDVESMSTISTALRADINRSAGALFQRLLVDSCRTESKLALKYEGQPALNSAFGLLGQIAMQELFSNPKVAAGLAELQKNMDEKKLDELSAPEPPPES
jgi:hypothetical protein